MRSVILVLTTIRNYIVKKFTKSGTIRKIDVLYQSYTWQERSPDISTPSSKSGDDTPIVEVTKLRCPEIYNLQFLEEKDLRRRVTTDMKEAASRKKRKQATEESRVIQPVSSWINVTMELKKDVPPTEIPHKEYPYGATPIRARDLGYHERSPISPPKEKTKTIKIPKLKRPKIDKEKVKKKAQVKLGRKEEVVFEKEPSPEVSEEDDESGSNDSNVSISRTRLPSREVDDEQANVSYMLRKTNTEEAGGSKRRNKSTTSRASRYSQVEPTPHSQASQESNESTDSDPQNKKKKKVDFDEK